MSHGLSAIWQFSDWRRPAIFATLLVVGVINVFLVGQALSWIVNQPQAPDWIVFQEASRRAQQHLSLYVWNDWYHYRWSPVTAYLFVAIAPLGLTVWRLLQVAAVATLSDRRLGVVVLISWPFWFDVETGNTLVFTFVLAFWALRGSRSASFAYLALFLLIPRPVALPIAVWMLWKRPQWRTPTLALAAVIGALTLFTGQAFDWSHALVAARNDLGHELNIGPSRFLGLIWVPIGLAAAVVLTLKGRLGWASLAASPYVLPYYLLFGMLELSGRQPPAGPGSSADGNGERGATGSRG
jgi:hypothetical protein